MYFILNKFYVLIFFVDCVKVVILIEKYFMFKIELFKLKGIIGYKWFMFKCFVNNLLILFKRIVRC